MSKTGWCFTCRSENIEVNWDSDSRKFYCNSCWVPQDRVAKTLPQDIHQISADEHFRIRDNLYGVHLSDDIRVGEPFMVRCPKCGIVASGLTLPQGRIVVQEHLDVHTLSLEPEDHREDQEPTVQQEEEPHVEISLPDDLLMMPSDLRDGAYRSDEIAPPRAYL